MSGAFQRVVSVALRGGAEVSFALDGAEGDVVARAVCETGDGGAPAATNTAALPRLSFVVFSTRKLDTGDYDGDYELFEGLETATADSPRVYTCPISANYRPPIRIRFADVEYTPSATLVEPREVVTAGASRGANVTDLFYDGNRFCWPRGEVGAACLVTTNYIGPMHVSFQGIAVSEVPCNSSPNGKP